jgi:hypothetical protein
MHDSPPSALVVSQRIRNRVIEYLESVVSYQPDPPAFDLNELLNQWNDWVPDQVTLAAFPNPTYSAREAELLVAVGVEWNDLCDVTPKTISDEVAVLHLPGWQKFCAAAQYALLELKVRGRLSESQEAFQ